MPIKDNLEKIVPYFLECINNKNYQEIIDINISKWSNYLVMLSWEDLIYYNLLVWAAYQETWDLYRANDYFDNYLYLVNAETLEKLLTPEWIEKIKDMNDYQKRFYLFWLELQHLWINYILPNESEFMGK